MQKPRFMLQKLKKCKTAIGSYESVDHRFSFIRYLECHTLCYGDGCAAMTPYCTIIIITLGWQYMLL